MLSVKLVSNTILANILTTNTGLGVKLVQIIRGGVPCHGLVLGAGLGDMVPALLVTVQSAVLASKPSPDNPPQYGVAQVAVRRGGVVVLLKPVRMCVGSSTPTL